MSANLAAYVPVPLPVPPAPPRPRVVPSLMPEPVPVPVGGITAYRAPDPEPPYDDDVDPPPARSYGRAHLLGPLPGTRTPIALRLVSHAVDGRFGPMRTSRDDLEDPAPRASMLARAVLETLAGDRPVGQLTRWTTPEVYDILEPLAAAKRQRPWVATLKRVLVSEPAPGVAEVTAIIERGPRTGALALRLEGVDGRWLVTALQVG